MEKKTDISRTTRLGTESVPKLILMMALPAILGNLMSAAYNIIDRMFVGRFVGSDALAAIAVLFPLTNVTTALSLFMSIGGAAMLSISLGAKDQAKADRVFTNVIIQAIVSGGLLALTYGLFTPSLVALCGAAPGTELHTMAVSYLRITSAGQIFLMLNIAFASTIRAQGNIRYAMFASVIGGFLSVTLDSILVGRLGFGIRGAAISTFSSQFISGFIGFLFFVRGKSVVKWAGFRVVHIRFIFSIIVMGMAPSTLQALSFVTNMFINRSLMYYGGLELARGGSLAIAAVSVTATVESFLLTIIMGVNQAISPVISYNYGSGATQRVRQATLFGQALATGASLLVWALMMFTPQTLFHLFNANDAELVAFGVRAMRISKCGVFVLGFQTLASMFFSATGRPKRAVLISISRQGAFLIPALLLFPRIWGVTGVAAANAFSDFCSVIVVGLIYSSEIRALARQRRTEVEGGGPPKAAEAPGAV
ncbi:MAG: MATE family efflux transporter [Clostridiales bacterium]|nr:MATE family efflux transporter [Clostridiales bacterium]